MSKLFSVRMEGEWGLTPEEIWPDGDAPENPTAEDVIDAMREHAGSVEALVADWQLVPNVSVDGKPVDL